ncbi:MAG: S41 family peptidase [Clostridium sp.]|uniref:S41 family peptidase n=1 Tax=Clostridium sp. TaxID=1506 RepID=UPI00257B191B|nr:S41 family peptidase [Clostridium sp.]MDU2284179.1 S41 family peptidase [Clostridium sp.]MDU3677961.1 S41 family peptidase [Clostridium sp.]MDU6937018.1 S41 family peptidase [Clostridium sp.]
MLEAKEAENIIYESIKLPSCNMSQEEMYSLFITKDNMNVARNYYNYDNNVILKKDANEDINLLFDAFKFGYGGYEVFGGDEVFTKAKNNILKEINSHDNLLVKDLENILISNLSFIKDNHFRINENPVFKEKYTYYYNNDYPIIKDGKEYYINLENKKYKIESINKDKDIGNYIRYTLNKNGVLSYELGILSLENKQLEVLISNNDNKKTIPINLEQSNNTVKNTSIKDSNIGYIKLNSMKKISDDILNKTKSIKNNRVNILDLRGCSGGSDLEARKWFETYFNQEIGINGTILFKYTEFIKEMYINEIKRSYELGLCSEEEFINEITRISSFYSKEKMNSIIPYTEVDKTLDNDNYLLVLVDNTIASSAESLLIYLRTVKNVVFIGTNSSGTTKIMDKLGFLLPNTKIVCAFGTKAYNFSSFEIEEGKGLEPDIWLGTEDILDRAYKFAKTLK